MTALIVILAIVLFLLLLMLLPLTLYIGFEDKLCLKLGYLFIKIRLFPLKPKKPKRRRTKKPSQKVKKAPKPDKPKPEEENKLKEILDKTGVSGFIEIISEIARIVGAGAMGIVRHAVIKRLKLDVDCGGEDAADAAISCGYISAAVYPALGIILSAVKDYKNTQININPDYDSEEKKVKLDCAVRVKPWWLIVSAVKTAAGLIKEALKLKRQEII